MVQIDDLLVELCQMFEIAGHNMTAEDILDRLDRVRRSGRQWVARCPAHDDRNPSLTIREGNQGVLLKCWAGCQLDEIMQALRLSKRDLFFHAEPDPRLRQENHRRREAERRQREQQEYIAGLCTDARREAARLIASACDIPLEGWSEQELHTRLDALADAHAILAEEGQVTHGG